MIFEDRYKLYNAIKKLNKESDREELFNQITVLYKLDPGRYSFIALCLIVFAFVFLSIFWGLLLLSIYTAWYGLYLIVFYGVMLLHREKLKIQELSN